MPILAVDKHGRIFQTSPDRADGLGYGASPESVCQGDLTLGSAYLRSNDRRTKELLKLKRQQDMLDEQERRLKIANRHQAKMNKRQIQAEERMMDFPGVQKAAVKKALSMGCSCDYRTPMSGNVMTSNGLNGFAGMSRDQQTIHHVLSGMGTNTAHRVDPVEAEMFRQKEAAQKILRLKSLRGR